MLDEFITINREDRSAMPGESSHEVGSAADRSGNQPRGPFVPGSIGDHAARTPGSDQPPDLWPREAKLELKERLSRFKAVADEIETTDKLPDPQIVAKVKNTTHLLLTVGCCLGDSWPGAQYARRSAQYACHSGTAGPECDDNDPVSQRIPQRTR